MAARAQGESELAIAYHDQARALFVGAAQPTLAVKSLINTGANYQDLANYARAGEVYAEAVTLLERADLPPSYPNRVLLERDLGLLAYQAESVEQMRPAIAHFEFVLEHGTQAQGVDALELLIASFMAFEEREQTLRWSEAALARIASSEPRPVSGEERARLEAAAGLALAGMGDVRGEGLLESALAGATQLDLPLRFTLQIDWVDWLESEQRCAEAEERRRALAELDPELLPPDYPAWASTGPSAACKP